jgi:hypothetical protein
MNICMTFNGSAESLTKHGYARPVDVAEGLDLLRQAYEHNLVQFGENVRQGVNFICNCCGCCCEAMIAARRFGLLHPVHITNFLPNQVLASHCALAAVLGVILKLPPLKQALAGQQMRSRYLEALISRMKVPAHASGSFAGSRFVTFGSQDGYTFVVADDDIGTAILLDIGDYNLG